ncbi:MAG: DNA alkylation repair protein, partial [candidate division WOR-3 bacterium]
RGRAFEQAYRMADILLRDEDDMVQKGYGWLLKEMANLRPREVFEFVLKRKDRMPRTALRYAIEKMPPAWKKQAMARPRKV